MVSEGGDTMGDKVQTWRVVLATGEVRQFAVGEHDLGVPEGVRWRVRGAVRASAGWSARTAVIDHIAAVGMAAVEILAPGEPTRAELAAEVAHLRAENATLRASTDAAVDGVRAMLPAALKIAREEGAAELRALMAGRTTPPTREEFDALADIGATLRVRWPGGDDEIPTHGDYYWTAIATVPDGSRWWAHGADGALIEWPKVTP